METRRLIVYLLAFWLFVFIILSLQGVYQQFSANMETMLGILVTFYIIDYLYRFATGFLRALRGEVPAERRPAIELKGGALRLDRKMLGKLLPYLLLLLLLAIALSLRKG